MRKEKRQLRNKRKWERKRDSSEIKENEKGEQKHSREETEKGKDRDLWNEKLRKEKGKVWERRKWETEKGESLRKKKMRVWFIFENSPKFSKTLTKETFFLPWLKLQNFQLCQMMTRLSKLVHFLLFSPVYY